MKDFYLSPLYPPTIQKGTEVGREKDNVGDQDGFSEDRIYFRETFYRDDAL